MIKKEKKQDMTTTVIRKKHKINSYEMQLYTFMILPVIYIFIFNYIPMIGSIITFKDYRYNLGIFGSKWVGFKNFEFFFKSDAFLRILRNTLVLNGLFIVFGVFFAVMLGILLYHLKSRLSTKIYQTVLITPNFISWVIAAYMVYAFLNVEHGTINVFLEKIGLQAIDWYAEPEFWPVILMICNIWKHVGMDSVMYYAALMGIDSSLFEAAEVDGANRFQSVIHIMIPTIRPVITILTIMKIGAIFRADFGLFYSVTRNVGLLYETTDVVDTYIYRAMRDLGDMGMSSAVSLLQSIVGFVMVMGTNYIVKKVDPDSSLF